MPDLMTADVVPADIHAAPAPVRAAWYRHPFAIAVAFGAVALALLLFGIKRPPMMFYDEGYFVPEAKVFLHGSPNPDPPQEKPPLGKMFLSLGIKAAGDNSLGWRVSAAVFGAMTVPAIFLWTYLLLEDVGLASLAAALSLFNNFLFVMSRIGMMDAFLMFFLIWSLASFTAALVTDVGLGRRRFLLCSSGVLLGLAGACKWNAIDSLLAVWVVTAALLWISYRPIASAEPLLSRYAERVRQIGIPVLALGLVVAPIASYCLAFWPLCRAIHRPFNLSQLVEMHRSIWHFNTTTISNPAITMRWYLWPFNLGPQRALSYLVGNPFVAWTGLAALAVCLRRFWQRFSLADGLIFLLFAANYLQWAVTPEKGLFYYYYYPSVIMLGVAIAVALRSLPSRVFGIRISLLIVVAAAVFFLRCYPQMTFLESPWDCAFGCWP